LVPLQMVIGDMHGLNTRKYQPAKLAAIEARWDTGKGVPLTLFAIPDDKAEHNSFAIEIPWLGSLILAHDINGEVKGLKDFPADQRPPVAIPFFAFRAIAGWFVTEVGRQPWTIYGLLRTAASVSPSLTASDVTLSLLGYIAVYLLIYPSGLIVMLRLVRKGPVEITESASAIEAGRAAAPVLAPANNVVKGEV